MDKNLIECATCGYPLTKDERTGLTEINGKMYRPWVGLSGDEKQEILEKNTHPDGRYGSYTTTLGIINDTEAKLREKNAYGWQSVANPTEYLDELRGGRDDGTNPY